MQAVSFNVSVPGFLLAKGLGRYTEAALFGGLSGVRFGEVAEPSRPGEDWVKLDILASGICGTDVATLSFYTSTSLEPFGSFPAVLGHEIIAKVAEVGPSVRGFEVGQRVTVDPFVSCTMRGFKGASACSSCGAGRHATCERSGDEGELVVGSEPVQRGMVVGYHASFPGGWSERMIAHESQLFPVDDAISTPTAALIEPLSIAVHAVLNLGELGPGPALVIGSGPIALATVWALRALGYQGELLSQVKRDNEAAIARSFGASQVVAPGNEAREALFQTGAKAYDPIIGDEVYAGGGFPLVFDCVGKADTLTQAIRYASPRARIVVLGCAPEIPKLDLSFLWARELEILGFVGYGRETFRGEKKHTFEVTHDLLLETGVDAEALVTHTFGLSDYRTALSAAANRRQSGSIKVLLEP
jgi:threonine dehydrogenase-like Zn-dependent dehydrogenase